MTVGGYRCGTYRHNRTESIHTKKRTMGNRRNERKHELKNEPLTVKLGFGLFHMVSRDTIRGQTMQPCALVWLFNFWTSMKWDGPCEALVK
jgi:hypothetical protein